MPIFICMAFLLFTPVALAAKRAPAAGVGGLPYKAPLQPIPSGVGANISNNIQQSPDVGPPGSASTVTPVRQAGEQPESNILQNEKTATISETKASTTPLRIGFWIAVLAGIIICIVWLWHITNRGAPKNNKSL